MTAPTVIDVYRPRRLGTGIRAIDGREVGKRAGLLGEYGYAAAVMDCLRELNHGGLIVNNMVAPYYPREEGILPSPPEGGGSW